MTRTNPELTVPEYVPDDVAPDELLLVTYAAGWRIEVWKSGFWRDLFGWRIRPVPRGDEPVSDDAPCGGWGCRSIEAAKTAAIADFKERMRIGYLKPRPDQD